MDRRQTFAVLCAITLLLAGCLGEAETSDKPVAPAPTVSAETGAITGHVVSDDLVPQVDAEVFVLETKLSTRTDRAGAFTLDGLDPGTYSLAVGAEGFDDALKRVDVKAGEITITKFELRVKSADAFYYWSFSRTSIVTGNFQTNQVVNAINSSVVDALFCTCSWFVTLRPNIEDAVTEALFEPSTPLPLVNKAIRASYTHPGAAGFPEELFSHYFEPGETYHWDPKQVDLLDGIPNAHLRMSGPQEDGIAFQQRVEIWQTFSHGKVLPDDFSILPP